MAGTQIKISDLPLATSLDGNEVIEVVKGGVNVRVEVSQIAETVGTGKSAYDSAVEQGFIGTEAQWVASLKGVDGESAYQSAVDAGFVGTEAEWVASLTGAAGKDGNDGADGLDGKDAYEVAVATGFSGTRTDWINSLKGDTGARGIDGINGERGYSAYDIAVNYGFSGNEQEWLVTLRGLKGDPGNDGVNGVDGESAYQLAVGNGYVGTLQDWIASNKGKDGTSVIIKGELATQGDLPADDPVSSAYLIAGDLWIKGESGWFDAGQFMGIAGASGRSAYQTAVDNGFVGTEQTWLDSLKGAQGDVGPIGAPGESAYQIAVDNGFVGTPLDWLATLKGVKGDPGTGGTGSGGGVVAEMVIDDSSTIIPTTLDATQADTFTIKLTANLALPAIANPVPGQTYTLIFMQDQAGQHSLSVDKKYKFVNNVLPTPSTAGSAIDVMEATYSSSGFFYCLFYTGYTITSIARIGSTKYDSMAQAVTASVNNDTIYVTRSGQMSECVAAIDKDVTLTIAGDPSVNGVPKLHVDSTVHLGFSKGILDPEQGHILIRDLALDGAATNDLSGSGVRGNPGIAHLRLERVTITKCQNGMLYGAPSLANTITDGYNLELIDCVFDNNGQGYDGQSHNIYLNTRMRVYALRTQFTNAAHGHDFKTRAFYVLLDRTIHSGAQEARELDVPNGGIIHAVNCSFIKGPNASQKNLIGIGQEGVDQRQQEYIFRNCLFQNAQDNFSETFLIQNNSSVPVKFIDCVFVGTAKCIIASPFELYYTGGPIGPEGWDQNNRGTFPPKGGDYDSSAGNQVWAQQPAPVYGPDPTLVIFPPTGSTSTPSVRPENTGPDVTAPNVTITSSSTTITSNGSITLTANASDNIGVTKVEFYRETTLIATKTNAPYTFDVALTDADNGDISFTAQAYDQANNSTVSSPVTVSVSIMPPPTVYPFSMDDQTTTDYNAAISAAALGVKRMAGAQAIVSDFNPYRLYIYQENTLVVAIPFSGSMTAADDGTDVTVSTGVPDPTDPLIAADINSGTWHFDLQGGSAYARSIKGSVGPSGSGKMIELSDSPSPGTGMSISFTMKVPRSVDGLS